MGYELRRWLRGQLGSDIKGLKRAIALEIADDARYDDDGNYDPNGRRSHVRLSELVEWTAAKDERTVREELRRLALAGWEFRIPIGEGKDGRTLFAVPGRAMQFRVPEGPTAVVSEGPTVVASDAFAGEEGPTVVAEGPTIVVTEATTVASEATVVGPPSPSRGSLSSLVPPATAEPVAPPVVIDEREKILNAYVAALGRPVDAEVRAQILAQAGELLAAEIPWWWIADRARELPQYGFDLIKHCRMSKVPVEVQRPAEQAPACTAHDAFSRMIKDPISGELINCPDCHPAELARRRRQGAA